MVEIQGWVHPQGQSQRIRAYASAVGARGQVRQADGVTLPFDLLSAEVTARVGGIPRRLTLTDGSVFVTDDNDGIDAMLAAAGRPGGLVHRLERFHPRLIVLAVFVLVAFGAGLRWGLPAIADAAARATSAEVLKRMGRGGLDALDLTFLDPSALAPAQQGEIEAAFQDLLRAADLAGQPSLSFRASAAFGANAFALPGGQIFVTDDLVRLADSTDMVAAVLAHEIAHAELRHPARMVYRAGGLSLALVLVAGDAGSLVEESLGLGGFVLQNGYSRAFEEAADDRAAELLIAVGRDPGDLAAMLSLLLQGCGPACDNGGWLATHPAVSERIARLTGR